MNYSDGNEEDDYDEYEDIAIFATKSTNKINALINKTIQINNRKLKNSYGKLLLKAYENDVSESIVNKLIDLNANVMIFDSDEVSTLQHVIMNYTKNTKFHIQRLLKLGAILNVSSYDEHDILQRMCKILKIKISQFLIKYKENIKDSFGWLLHHYCDTSSEIVHQGTLKKCKILLEYKDDINKKMECYWDTALFRACHGGALYLVKLLVNNGADIYMKNDDDEFPLCSCVMFRRHPNTLKYMLSLYNKNEINHQNKDGDTILHILCNIFNRNTSDEMFTNNGEFISCLLLLLNSKIDTSIQNNDGMTVLHLLCNASSEESLKDSLVAISIIMLYRGKKLNK